VPLKQQAVLFRASHHSAPLEIELTRRNIPFVKFGGLKFLGLPTSKTCWRFCAARKTCAPDVNFPSDPASWRAPSRYRRERNFVSWQQIVEAQPKDEPFALERSSWRQQPAAPIPSTIHDPASDCARQGLLAKMTMVFKIRALRAIRSAVSHQGTRALRSLR